MAHNPSLFCRRGRGHADWRVLQNRTRQQRGSTDRAKLSEGFRIRAAATRASGLPDFGREAEVRLQKEWAVLGSNK